MARQSTNDGCRLTPYGEFASDLESDSSGTAQEYHSPWEGFSSGEEAELVHTPSSPRDELYLRLRKQAGQAGADFCSLHTERPIQAGGSSLAVFLLFGDESRRDECWTTLQHTLKVRAEVWFSGRQTPRSPTPSSSSESEDEDASVDDAATEECSIVLLLDLERPLSGLWTWLGLQRKVERYLGCPRSRGSRLHPTLRKVDYISFELISVYDRNTWIDDRAAVLAGCRKVQHVPEVAVTE